MYTSRGEDHFQTPADIEEQADPGEAKDPDGEKNTICCNMFKSYISSYANSG